MVCFNREHTRLREALDIAVAFLYRVEAEYGPEREIGVRAAEIKKEVRDVLLGKGDSR